MPILKIQIYLKSYQSVQAKAQPWICRTQPEPDIAHLRFLLLNCTANVFTIWFLNDDCGLYVLLNKMILATANNFRFDNINFRFKIQDQDKIEPQFMRTFKH